MSSKFLLVMAALSVAPAGLMAADFAAGLKAYENHDYAAAIEQWRPLAEKGDRAVQFNLGLMYMDGHGVPQDYAQAAEWFRKSAEQGYTKAQRNLGELLITGTGVKKDYVEAHKWLNLCSASGDSNCTAHRDQLAQKMKRAQIAEAQRRASEWRRKEALQQQYDTQTNPDAQTKP